MEEYYLKIDNDQFLITKRLYQEIMAETNLIADYDKCKVYVRKTLSTCKDEAKLLSNVKTKKFQIEL